MSTLRTVLLLAATLAMGLAAGVFALYAHTIMPGLETTDDRTFVAAFQALDRAIINPWFTAGTFFGALVLTAASVATNMGRPALGWVIAALVLYVVVVVITLAVNVPRGDAIKAAGDPDTIDVAHVRDDFHEARWAAWNLVRVAASLAAFASLAWALVLDKQGA
ncbi:MAG TPA: anthrone oxygenase family protein [Thermoleophilaceae bacterium]